MLEIEHQRWIPAPVCPKKGKKEKGYEKKTTGGDGVHAPPNIPPSFPLLKHRMGVELRDTGKWKTFALPPSSFFHA